MDNVSPIWFSYVIIIEHVVSILIGMTILTRTIIKAYGTVVDRSEKTMIENNFTTKHKDSEEVKKKDEEL